MFGRHLTALITPCDWGIWPNGPQSDRETTIRLKTDAVQTAPHTLLHRDLTSSLPLFAFSFHVLKGFYELGLPNTA